MRIAFFGTPQVAVPTLEALLAADDVEVAMVVTNPDRPRGRSKQPIAPPVKDAAIAAEVAVHQPAKPSQLLDELAAAELDACAVVAYGALLPRRVLDVPAHGFVNLHFSLLPRWRGAAPVQHALRAGDAVTGVTTFVLDEGMDTGPVLDRAQVAVGSDETTGTLLERLATLGAPVLVDSLRALVAGTVPRPQPDQGVTLAGKITAANVVIDFVATSREVADLVRSADPAPGAHTRFRGARLKVWRARPVDDGPRGSDIEAGDAAVPGSIVSVGRDGVVVACGAGAVELTVLQPEGKGRIDGAGFVNGYRPRVGERLGDQGGGQVDAADDADAGTEARTR